MTYSNQKLHDVAQAKWSNQMVPANRMIWELRQIQKLLPIEIKDALYEASTKVTLLADQYRIFIPDPEPDSREIWIVEINSLDQDDSEEDYWTIKYSEFFQWYWENQYPDQDKPGFCKEYTNWLNENHGSGYYIKPDSFNPWCDDDQDFMMEHIGFDVCAETLKPYIDQVKLTEWGWKSDYTLLDDEQRPDTYEIDIHEHWIVSSELAHQLRQVDAMVVTIMGIDFWCRGGTGNSVFYDQPFQALAMIELEQREAA